MSKDKKLSEVSIFAWLKEHNIKTETGRPLSFYDHPFLFDIYRDMSPFQAILKPAQIGASTMMNIKPFWLMENMGCDIIYTLPTDADVSDFVGSKTNRLIANNPHLQELTKDRDTVEQKQVKNSMIYYRGTWSKKAAMMIPADILIMDEVDASKQEILTDYETRLRHSKIQWKWYFSHPTTEGRGIHQKYLLTDQKHWYITCPHCKLEQDLTWPDSINIQHKVYICKSCSTEITDDCRRRGRWKTSLPPYMHPPKVASGYWISSMICPWIPASDIIENAETKDPEYFYTKVLGLPYSGGGTKITKETILENCTPRVNTQSGKIVIGVDTGIKIHLVVGNSEGLFYASETTGYEELERLMARFPKAMVVIDQGGDLIAPRKLKEKYPGRIHLCYFRKDRKSMQLVAWGEGKEHGKVVADRNRLIQLVVDEFTDKRIPLQGQPTDWTQYVEHWNNMYRVEVENALGIAEKKWERSGPDHLALATVYWRVGMTRFGAGEGSVLSANQDVRIPTGITMGGLSKGAPASSITTFMFPDRSSVQSDD